MAVGEGLQELVEAGGEGIPCAVPAHERYAQALALHGNKTAAYREAYPNANAATANAHSSELSRHPDVARRVLELQKANRERLLALDIEALIANLCTGKAARLVDPETGRPIPLHLLPQDVQNALQGVKIRVTTTREGDTVVEYDAALVSPLQALKLLAQLRGALIERHDLTSGGKPLPPAVDPKDLPKLDAELHRRLLGAPEPPPPADNSDLIG